MIKRGPEIRIAQGSNVNGYWFKLLRRGVVKHVWQVMPNHAGGAGVRTKTLPTEMPGTNFVTSGSSGDSASLGGKRDYVTWAASNTTTTFIYAIRGGSSFEASSGNLVAEWSAAS